MAEDWRVTVTPSGVSGHELRDELKELAKEARHELGTGVAVSASDTQLFLYADARPAAEQGRSALEALVAGLGVGAEIALDRWHPIEERWEQADVPIPDTPETEKAEHDRLEQEEIAESEAAGYAEWEVRVTLGSRREAARLQDRLESEGLPVARRWSFLAIGARDEDEAGALADRLRGELPDDAEIEVQAGGEMVWEIAPPGLF
jgi:hypothetical protein